MGTTRTIRNWSNYKAGERFKERNTKPGLTVPDQTMSIKEIMERFARGIPMDNVAKIPLYEGDQESIPDVRTLDLSEIQALAEEARNLGNQFRDRRASQERAEQEQAAKELEELRASKKELEALKTTSTNTP